MNIPKVALVFALVITSCLGAGALAQTEVLKDFLPKKGASNPIFVGDLNNTKLFLARESANLFALYRTDGSAAGTAALRSMPELKLSTSKTISERALFSGRLFFMAQQTTFNPNQLWVTDGTVNGASLLMAPIATASRCKPALAGSPSGVLAIVYNESTGCSVFITDGLPSNTTQFLFSSTPPEKRLKGADIVGTLANGNVLLMTLKSENNLAELWSTNGTTAGTSLLKSEVLGSETLSSWAITGSESAWFSGSSQPALFFSYSDPLHGRELWRSDGTAAGSVLIADLNPGVGSSSISNITDANGKIVFTTSDATNPQDLWVSDGTAAGTLKLKDFPSASALQATLSDFNKFNGRVYFKAAYSVSDGNMTISSHAELWVSDGTIAGTQLLKSVGSIRDIFSNSSGVFVSADGVLSIVDGSAQVLSTILSKPKVLQIDAVASRLLLIGSAKVHKADQLWATSLSACPAGSLKPFPGICGCSVADLDSDNDGSFNCLDQCPTDAKKIVAGRCGCGALETDSDKDGTPDCVDVCPQDPKKSTQASCGCGLTETDVDKNGISDCLEAQLSVAIPPAPLVLQEGRRIILRAGAVSSTLVRFRFLVKFRYRKSYHGKRYRRTLKLNSAAFERRIYQSIPAGTRVYARYQYFWNRGGSLVFSPGSPQVVYTKKVRAA